MLEYEICGNLPCCIMPIGKEINLLGCNFTYLGHIKEHDTPWVLIKTKIDTEDAIEAERIGYENCRDAAYLLEICIGDRIHFDRKYEKSIMSFNNKNIFERDDHSMPLYNLNEISNLNFYIKKIESNNALIQKESVKRSIYWYNSACQEVNEIDSFLKLWIAFEILSGKSQKLRKKRSEIIHLGKRPANIEENIIQLRKLVSKSINEKFFIAKSNTVDIINQNLVSLNVLNKDNEKESSIVYEVSIPGEVNYDWPKEVRIYFEGCIFSEGNGLKNFLVSTYVTANNEDDAISSAREKINDASNFLEYLIGKYVIPSSSNVKIKRKGESHAIGMLSIGCGANISGHITDKELGRLERVQSILNQEAALNRESLIISIRWRARALWESESQIDRFLRFWIALEVLVNGEGKLLVDKVTKKLKELYPEVDEKKIRRVVGPIYGMRSDIVHKGVYRPQDLKDELFKLESIYEDLLKEKLCIESNYSSNKYFLVSKAL